MAQDENTLSLLHDHYKETFAFIRERETQRDRLFLWLLIIFAVLAIAIQYPANVGGTQGHLQIAGNDIDLSHLPFYRLLNAAWVFTAAFVLKYYQVTKTVERQYKYLHRLEKHISNELKGENIYSREGLTYLKEYPWLLTWARAYYTILFPAAFVCAVVYLLIIEWAIPNNSIFSKLFDTVFALCILSSLVLYLGPQLIRQFTKKPKKPDDPQAQVPEIPLQPAATPSPPSASA